MTEAFQTQYLIYLQRVNFIQPKATSCFVIQDTSRVEAVLIQQMKRRKFVFGTIQWQEGL